MNEHYMKGKKIYEAMLKGASGEAACMMGAIPKELLKVGRSYNGFTTTSYIYTARWDGKYFININNCYWVSFPHPVEWIKDSPLFIPIALRPKKGVVDIPWQMEMFSEEDLIGCDLIKIKKRQEYLLNAKKQREINAKERKRNRNRL